MSDMAAGASHAAREIGHESLNILVDTIAPLAGGVVGLIGGVGILGGTYSISNAILQVAPSLSAQNSRLGGFAAAVIFAGIGTALWHMRARGGWILKLIGGGAGGFFYGTAASAALVYGLPNRAAPQGALDSLFNWVEKEV
jgi:hypothetical protein